MLAHGYFGFENFAGLAFASYFFEVADHLEEEGETHVLTPAVDPFNDSTVRGEQLLAHIEAFLAETGHAKVNIIGHSQGGLDARVVAHLRPELVASVTTLGSPHRGSALNDVTLGLIQDENATEIIDAMVRLFATPLWDAAGEQTSIWSALEQLSVAGMAEFNEAYPDVEGLPYYSIAGRTDLHLGGLACAAENRPAFVRRYDFVVDPVDPGMAVMEAMLDGGLFDPFPNDGLVLVEGARWGRFLGCIPADHLDQVGQVFGDSPGFGNSFEHREFFGELIAWLRDQGH